MTPVQPSPDPGEPTSPAATLTTTNPDILRLTRWLKVNCVLLEGGVLLALAGSAVAFGAVHPWAYVPLWGLAAVLAGLTATRAGLVRALRQRLGRGILTCPPAGRWVVVSPQHEGDSGWHLDLRRSTWGSAPLLLPGAAMLLLVLLQLTPLPAAVRLGLFPAHPVRDGVAALSVSPADTWRGIVFLAAALMVHAAAAAALARRPARERLARALAVLVLLLGLIALLQSAQGARRIYGIFASLEGGTPFGPFVNRNHFATWMAMATCLALGAAQLRWWRYRQRVGERPNFRRRLVALQSGPGIALLYAVAATAVGVAVVVASTSRGGILAFVAAVALAGVGMRRARGVPAWAVAVAFLAASTLWYGVERLSDRFEMARSDAKGRTGAWSLAISRLDGASATGSGFNTFAAHVSRMSAWALPAGASPWPADFDAAARTGYRAPESERGRQWFREAHNDWLQVLVETGWPGLLISIWAGVVALRGARNEPWRFGALAAAMMHAFVDFSLQVPAVAILFVTVAAGSGIGARTSPRPGEP